MPRPRRSSDWGFPRWRDYEGAGKVPEAQRLCDREGCTNPGNCPAPKAPNRPDRWYFCDLPTTRADTAEGLKAKLEQLRRGLPLQSVTSCDAALALAPGLNRARYIRALGHWRLQQLALAEDDLTSSLDARHGLAPQGEDRARRLRARGAVRMQRRDLAGMCEDFGAACALGECEGLMLARSQGYCLPSTPAETGVGAKARQQGEYETPERENTGQRGAENWPAPPLGALESPGPQGPSLPDMPNMQAMPDGKGGAKP